MRSFEVVVSHVIDLTNSDEEILQRTYGGNLQHMVEDRLDKWAEQIILGGSVTVYDYGLMEEE